jgi:hypothetical protein
MKLIIFISIILCSCKSLYDTNRIVIVRSFDGFRASSILRDQPDSFIFRYNKELILNQTYLVGENMFGEIIAVPVEDDYIFSGNSNVKPLNELLLNHK